MNETAQKTGRPRGQQIESHRIGAVQGLRNRAPNTSISQKTRKRLQDSTSVLLGFRLALIFLSMPPVFHSRLGRLTLCCYMFRGFNLFWSNFALILRKDFWAILEQLRLWSRDFFLNDQVDLLLWGDHESFEVKGIWFDSEILLKAQVSECLFPRQRC